jgi:hypothetical protein
VLDIECTLVDLFHWPLSQIDATDIESLIPFIFFYPHRKDKDVALGAKRIFADQADWL